MMLCWRDYQKLFSSCFSLDSQLFYLCISSVSHLHTTSLFLPGHKYMLLCLCLPHFWHTTTLPHDHISEKPDPSGFSRAWFAAGIKQAAVRAGLHSNFLILFFLLSYKPTLFEKLNNTEKSLPSLGKQLSPPEQYKKPAAKVEVCVSL